MTSPESVRFLLTRTLSNNPATLADVVSLVLFSNCGLVLFPNNGQPKKSHSKKCTKHDTVNIKPISLSNQRYKNKQET